MLTPGPVMTWSVVTLDHRERRTHDTDPGHTVDRRQLALVDHRPRVTVEQILDHYGP